MTGQSCGGDGRRTRQGWPPARCPPRGTGYAGMRHRPELGCSSDRYALRAPAKGQIPPELHPCQAVIRRRVGQPSPARHRWDLVAFPPLKLWSLRGRPQVSARFLLCRNPPGRAPAPCRARTAGVHPGRAGRWSPTEPRPPGRPDRTAGGVPARPGSGTTRGPARAQGRVLASQWST